MNALHGREWWMAQPNCSPMHGPPPPPTVYKLLRIALRKLCRYNHNLPSIGKFSCYEILAIVRKFPCRWIFLGLNHLQKHMFNGLFPHKGWKIFNGWLTHLIEFTIQYWGHRTISVCVYLCNSLQLNSKSLWEYTSVPNLCNASHIFTIKGLYIPVHVYACLLTC